MATPFVIQQLAKKLKLEAQVSPKLNRFFREISRSITPVLRVTGRVPTLNSFRDDLIEILTKHYMNTSKAFKGDVVTQVTKSASFGIETKQETIEAIVDESESVLNEALAATIAIRAPKQADFILATTEKELNQSVEKVSIEAAKNGERLTLAEQGKRAARDFNDKIPGRVETIAMFETQAMAEDTKITEAQVIALAGVVLRKEWNTILDEVTRSSHVIADGQKKPLALPFIVQGQALMMPGDTLLGASLDNVINCLHPDSVVQACDPVNLTRRLYEGDMFTIQTSSVNSLTVTPNHPILTVSGWKPARLINESDYIITANSGKVMSFCDFNIDNVNTSIEQIYNSVNIEAVTMRVGSLDMNFHGDISNHDVDIIFSDGLLRDAFKSLGVHVSNKIRFKHTSYMKRLFFGNSLVDIPGIGNNSTPHRFIGFLGKLLSIFRRSLTHPQIHRFTFASSCNARFFESVNNYGSRTSNLLGNFFYREWFVKHFSDEIDLFSTTKVLKTHKSSYKGYVYNLEDTQSYYICNGIVNHNCRCTTSFSL